MGLPKLYEAVLRTWLKVKDEWMPIHVQIQDWIFWNNKYSIGVKSFIAKTGMQFEFEMYSNYGKHFTFTKIDQCRS